MDSNNYNAVSFWNASRTADQTLDTNIPIGDSDGEHSPRQILAERLEEAELDTKRLCKIHKQKVSFSHHKTLYRPEGLPTGNYGVKGVGDLVIIDVDEWDETTDELRTFLKETPTFTVKSPHADDNEGHYYYRCTGSVPDKSPKGVDVQSNGSLVVGPGSELESCNKTDHDCSLPGHGQYTIKEDRPIASIEWEELPISDRANKEEPPTPPQTATQYDLPVHDEELADVGNAILHDLKAAYPASYVQLTKLLEGGVGRYADKLTKTDNGEERIDRSQQENLALLFLYGTIRQVSNEDHEDRAKRILYATFDHHMRANQKTADGQTRKWVERGEDYQASAIGSVIRDFNRGTFTKYLNLSSTPIDYRFRSGKCSELNLNFGRFAVDLLSGALGNFAIEAIAELAQTHYNIHITKGEVEAVVGCSDHKGRRGIVVESVDSMQNRDGFEVYPTRAELYEAVKTFGSNLSNEDSFRDHVLVELKESGMVKHASNGKNHVYYSSHLPDPDGAYWVRTEGEEYMP